MLRNEPDFRLTSVAAPSPVVCIQTAANSWCSGSSSTWVLEPFSASYSNRINRKVLMHVDLDLYFSYTPTYFCLLEIFLYYLFKKVTWALLGAEPAGCQTPTLLKDGDTKYSMKVQYSHNERVEYVCQNLYTMEGGPFRTCTDGEWTGHIRCLSQFDFLCLLLLDILFDCFYRASAQETSSGRLTIRYFYISAIDKLFSSSCRAVHHQRWRHEEA